MFSLLRSTLLILLVVGCEESNFESGTAVVEPNPPAITADAEPELEPIPDRDLVVEDIILDEQLQAKLFSYGKPDKPIDYLFVIDNSSSMVRTIDLFNAGFASILGEEKEVFPANSKLAVMSTMIGDPNDFTKINDAVKGYNGIEMEPGFLDFVNQTAIMNYRDNVPGRAGNWTVDGCANKWFAPNDKNGAGVYCLTAATQSTFSGLATEAGITAYEQLLIKNAMNPTFRPGALVNIIYVSDTHDPGRNEQELIDNRKNFAQLEELTKVYNKINGLKFHAMAPASDCSSENTYDFSYYTLVDASKGQKGDYCVSNDYTEFLKKMVEASMVAEPVFEFGKTVTSIVRIKVDGEEVTDYKLNEDKTGVRIEGLDPKVPVDIQILFETAEANGGEEEESEGETE